MAVYEDTDLQQYKLKTQLSLLPDMVQSMGYDTSRFDIADLLDFFRSLGNARKLLLSEICILGKLMLGEQGWRSGRALAFHQCGPGSIPGLGVLSGLSLLVLYSAPRGFSPGTPAFPSPQKLTFDLI